MITRFAIEGYRSLRRVVTTLAPLTVVTGSNGAGKSSLYRALRLLAAVGQGNVVGSVATEGGLDSVLWAGPEQGAASMLARGHPVQGTRRRGPVALRLGFAGPDEGYALDLGLPVAGGAFPRDPEIKAEAVWIGGTLSRHGVIAERKGPAVRLRTPDGVLGPAVADLRPWDSMLTHATGLDPGGRLLHARETLRRWRFYDALRTDRDAPARSPAVPTRTPVLAEDGSDLGPALVTILEIGDGRGLQEAIAGAFDGAQIAPSSGGAGVGLVQPGLLRAMDVRELSDGTLRYLLLMAALFSPRPPALLVLNEPEASLHPQLLAPLANQIIATAASTQTVVISHAETLTRQLVAGGAASIMLRRSDGETMIDDDDPPNWVWPSR